MSRRIYAEKLTTAQRGYGRAHQKMRRAYIEAFRSGDPCVRCGEPMVGDGSLFDLDHTDDRTGYLGLSHRECNRRTQTQNRGTSGRVAVCDYCGLEYRTRRAEQIYCSVPCQKAGRRARAEERRAARKLIPQQLALVFQACAHCGVLHPGRGKYCSKRCSDRAYNSTRRSKPALRMGVACSDCGAPITPKRWKCDECIRATRRVRKRRERQSEGGRRRSLIYQQRKRERKREQIVGGGRPRAVHPRPS